MFFMPLSREAVYNDLNGIEIKEILLDRFSARLAEVPWLQRHLTLPRVRMKLSVAFEIYADQPTPEVHSIDDDFTIRTESDRTPPPIPVEHEFEDVIDASPDGDPPDQIREEAGIDLLTPTRNRQTGFTEDVLSPGVKIARGSGPPSPSRGATIITQDFGPQIARRGDEAPTFKNSGRSADPAPVLIRRKE